MSKFVILAAFALIGGAAVAEEEADAEMIHYGGFLTKPDAGNSHIAIINTQDKVAVSNIQAVAEYFDTFLPVNFRIVPKDNNDPKAKFKIFIINDAAGSSISLISPEERWAKLNVALLAESCKGKGHDVLEDRTRKELIRTIAWLCGSGSSQYQRTMMAGMPRGVKDLDYVFKLGLPPDTLARMRSYLAEFGVRPVQTVTYYRACVDGWAPQPTNKWQQAVWDKVHAPPEKPLKITFDKDKQKPVLK